MITTEARPETNINPNPQDFVAPLKDIIRRASQKLNEQVPNANCQQYFYWTGDDESVVYHFARNEAEPSGCLPILRHQPPAFLTGDLKTGFHFEAIWTDLRKRLTVSDAPRNPTELTANTVWKLSISDLPALRKIDDDLKWGHEIRRSDFQIISEVFHNNQPSTPGERLPTKSPPKSGNKHNTL